MSQNIIQKKFVKKCQKQTEQIVQGGGEKLGAPQKLKDKIQYKIAKGKTLEQIADELGEDRSLYEGVTKKY